MRCSVAASMCMTVVVLLPSSVLAFGDEPVPRRRQQQSVSQSIGKSSGFMRWVIRGLAGDLSMMPTPTGGDSWSSAVQRNVQKNTYWRFRRSQLTGLRTGAAVGTQAAVQTQLAEHFLTQVLGAGTLEIDNVLALSGFNGFAHAYWKPAAGKRRLLTSFSFGSHVDASGDSGAVIGQAQGSKRRVAELSVLWKTPGPPTGVTPEVAARVEQERAAIPALRNEVQRYLGRELLSALDQEAATNSGAVKSVGAKGSDKTWIVRPRGLLQRIGFGRPSLLHALQQRFKALDAADASLKQANLARVGYRETIFQPIAAKGPASRGELAARFPVAAARGVRGGVVPLELSWTEGGVQHQLRVAGSRATYCRSAQ